MAPFDGFTAFRKKSDEDTHIEWTRSKYRTALTGSASRTAFLAGAAKKAPAHPRGRPQRIEPLEPRILLSADSVVGLGGLTDNLLEIDDPGTMMADEDGVFRELSDKITELIDDTDTEYLDEEAPGLRANQDEGGRLAPTFRELFTIDLEQLFDDPADYANGTTLGDMDANDDMVIDFNEALSFGFMEPLQAWFDSYGTTNADTGTIAFGDMTGMKRSINLDILDTDGNPKLGGDGIPDLANVTIDEFLNGFMDAGTDFDTTDDDVAIPGLNDFLVGYTFTLMAFDLGLTTFSGEDIALISIEIADFTGATVDGGNILFDMTLNVTLKNEYLIDLGTRADDLSIRLPGDSEQTTNPPTVDVSAVYSLPVTLSASANGSGFTFTPNDVFTFEIIVDETFTGSDSIEVDVGFLGMETTEPSIFQMNVDFSAEVIDPSSPYNLGFESDAFLDGGAGFISNADGTLTASEALDPSFSQDILFTIQLGAQGDNSPTPFAITLDASAISDMDPSAVVTAINDDIPAGLAGFLEASLDEGMLKISLIDGDSAANFQLPDNAYSAGGSILGSSAIADDFTMDFDFAGGDFLLSLGGGSFALVSVAPVTINNLGTEAGRRAQLVEHIQMAINSAVGGDGMMSGVEVSLDGSYNLQLQSVGLNSGDTLEITRTLTMAAEYSITAEELRNAAAGDLFIFDVDPANDNFEISFTLNTLDGVDISGTDAVDGESFTITRDLVTDADPGVEVDPQFTLILDTDSAGFERFDGENLTLSAGFDELLQFTQIGTSDILSMLSQLAGWLDRLPSSEIFGDFGIPFTEGNLSDLFTFGETIADDLLADGKLVVSEAIDGVEFFFASFDTVQELGKRLAELGVLGDGLNGASSFMDLETRVKYDSDTNDLTYHIEVDANTSATADLDFDLEFEPLANASVEGELSLFGSLKFETLFGVNLDSGVPITNMTPVVPGDGAVNNGDGIDINDSLAVTGSSDISRIVGRLTDADGSSANFDVTIGGDTYSVSIPVSATENNTRIDDLLLDINNALEAVIVDDMGDANPDNDTTLGDLVQAVDVAGRIALQAADPSVDRFGLTVDTNDASYRQLGLRTTAASTVSVFGNQIDDVSSLTGTADLDFFINGEDTAAFSVTGFDLENGGEGYNTLNDLLDDLNTAIAAADGVSDQEIVAVRDGNAIVFAAVDGDIVSFRIGGPGLGDLGLVSTLENPDFVPVAGPFLVGEPIFLVDDIAANKAGLQFGRLDSTQEFAITVDTDGGSESVSVMITAAETAEFSSIGDLADLINMKIGAAVTEVDTLVEVVTVGSNQLVIRSISDDALGITIDANAPQLGLFTAGSQAFDGDDGAVVDIGSAAESITINAHGFATGAPVTYSVEDGETAIGGLEDGRTYFIISVDANTVQLAETAAEAFDGVAIDLTALGTGMDSHSLTVNATTSAASPLGVIADRIAPFYFGPATDATFTINYETFDDMMMAVAETPVMVTITADEAANNRFVFDLINDVNRALNDAFGGAAGNPFVADFDGDRLVIRAKADADIASFSIASDSAAAEDLKLAGFDGSTTITANKADLLIFTQDGSVFEVDLSGDMNIGDVIASIDSDTSSNVSAIVEPTLELALQLEDQTTAAAGNVFRIVTVNGSNAAYDLGLVQGDVISLADDAGAGDPMTGSGDDDSIIVGDIITRPSIADRLFIQRVDADTEMLSATVTLLANIADDPMTEAFEGIAAEFGFVGVTLETDGVQLLSATAGLGLKDADPFFVLAEDPLAIDKNNDGVVNVFDVAEFFSFPVVEIVPNGGVQAFDGSDTGMGATVDLDANTITFGAPHGLVNGEAVIYTNGGDTSIGGLDDGADYYAIVINDTTIQLATSKDNAEAAAPVAIDLTSAGTGTMHTIQAYDSLNFVADVGAGDLSLSDFNVFSTPMLGLDVLTFGDPINIPQGALTPFDASDGTIVDLTDNTIQLTDHGFETGNAVVYRTGVGGEAIKISVQVGSGGSATTEQQDLINGKTYYVIVVDDDHIQLASTEQNALGVFNPSAMMVESKAIDLDGLGSGTEHRLQGFNPIAPEISVSVTDFEDLFNFGNLEFDDILGALRAAADFLLKFIEDAPFLEVEIPVLGVSIADLVDIADDFIAAVDDITNNPPATLQALIDKVIESFGLPPASDLPFLFEFVDDNDQDGMGGGDGSDADMLKIIFDFDKVFSEALQFNFGLGDAGSFGPISLVGNAGLGASGGFFAKLTLGIDLDTDVADENGVVGGDSIGEIFIFNHESQTGLEASLRATSADVNFNASIGPIGASIIGGDALIAAGVIFTDQSASGPDSRVSIINLLNGEIDFFGLNFEPAFATEPGDNAEVDITLPVFFPSQSDFVGDIGLQIQIDSGGNFGDPIVSIPDDLLNVDFLSNFDIFTSIPLMIDAIDLLLGTIQDTLQGEVFGIKLPFIEPGALEDAVQFIEDIRTDFVAPFIELFENSPKSGEELADLLSAYILALLGDGIDPLLSGTPDEIDGKQLFIDAFAELDALSDIFPVLNTGLGLLDNIDYDSLVGAGAQAITDFLADEIGLELSSDGMGGFDAIQWNFLLEDEFSPAVNGGFDLGLPALGLEANGGFVLNLGYAFGIGFGVSLEQGAFIDIDTRDGAPDIELFLTAGFAPNSEITGRLGFLQFDASVGGDDNEAPLTLGTTSEIIGGMSDGVSDDARIRAKFGIDLVSDSATDGRLSFFDLGNLEFDVLFNADANLDVMLELGFNDELLPPVASALFPSLQAGFEFVWGLDSQINLTEPGVTFDFVENIESIRFYDIGLNLGEFIGDFLGGIVAQIQDVTEPLQPIIDILTAPIPVLSDLAGEPISLVDIAASFGEFDPGLIYALADLITFVNSIPVIGGDEIILPIAEEFVIYGSGLFGDDPSKLADSTFDIAKEISEGGSLFDTFSNDALAAVGALADLFGDGGLNLDAFDQAFSGVGDAGTAGETKSLAKSVLGGGFDTEGGGFAFPIFENPASLIGVLFGQDVVLVTYDLPPLVVSFDWSQSFPIYPPLYGSIGAGISVVIDLAFGYDTLGVREFIDGGATNPLDLFRGLYISDTANPDGSGADVAELTFTGVISIGAELNAGVAKAGVAADIGLKVEFDLNDPDGDGRVRIDELIGNFLYEFNYGSPALAPIAIFDVGGEVFFQLRAFIEILLVIDLEFEITPPITLFEFSIEFDREPFLATERGEDEVLLNIGANADSRQHGNTDDIAEVINVRQVSGGFEVWSGQFNVSEGNAQFYSGNKLIANGGEFGDTINLYDFTTATFEIAGESGNDIIVVNNSTGSGTIDGGDGDDMITGGGGDETIYGGEGNDMIEAGAGADLVFGDLGRMSQRLTSASVGANDGDDDISGGDGADTIFGGGGSDKIGGDVKTSAGPDTVGAGHGADLIFGDGGRIVFQDSEGNPLPDGPEIRSTENLLDAPDIIQGHGGNDEVYGGRGDDSIDGGGDDDRLFGERGFDTIEGGGGADYIDGDDNNDVLWGNREDKTLVGDGPDGDDTIYGRDGNDYIRGDAANDLLFGGRGLDIIFGDTGDDEIEGGGGLDYIFGGAGSDTVDGGAGNDIVFGDDGLIVFFNFTSIPVSGDFESLPGNEVVGADRLIGDTALPVGDPYATANDQQGNTLDLIYTEVKATDGDDFVIGGEGDDIIIGGAGDDEIYGDFYIDTMDPRLPSTPLSADDDILFGDAGRVEFQKRLRDRILTVTDDMLAGNDTLSGNGGNDVLFGGGNNIGVGDEKDVLFGRHDDRAGSAFDMLSQAEKDRVNAVDTTMGEEIADNDIIIGDDGVIDYNFVEETTMSGFAQVFSTVETIYSLFATDADLTFGADPTVKGGADDIFGSKDSDTLIGGFGSDFMEGDRSDDFGEDVLIGDNGQIDYRVEIDIDGVVSDINDGGFDLTNIDGLTSRIELIFTTDTSDANTGDDTMTGSNANDILIGGGGADLISGGNQDDIVIGDNGQVIYNAEYMIGGKSFGVDPARLGLDVVTTDTAYGGSSPIAANTGLAVGSTFDIGGDDNLSGGGDKDIVAGGKGADNIFGDADLMGSVLGINQDEDILIGDQVDIFFNDDPMEFADDSEIPPIVYIDTTDTKLGATGGSDTIEGNDAIDVIIGGLAGDILRGNEGDDLIVGDEALIWYDADVRNGLSAGETTDLAILPSMAQMFFGLDDGPVTDDNLFTVDFIETTDPTFGGDDTILGNAGGDIALGGTGADVMLGDNDGDTATDVYDQLEAMSGQDILIGDQGLVSLNVGDDTTFAGNITRIETTDTLETDGSGDYIEGNDAADILIGGVNGVGAAFNDTLHGEADLPGNVGTGGGDIILGDEGFIRFDAGTDANDDFSAEGVGAPDDATLDVIYTFKTGMMSGDDIGNGFTALGGIDLIFGNEGDDIVMGGTDGDFIYGDLYANGATQADILAGTTDFADSKIPGSDALLGDGGEMFFESWLVFGGELAADEVTILRTAEIGTDTGTNDGFGGSDIIEGNEGGDIILGGAKGDILFGESDLNLADMNDEMIGDVILGDQGELIWILTSDAIVNRPDVATALLDNDSTTLDRIQTIAPTVGGADRIEGNAAGDTIFGGTEGDLIWGDSRDEEQIDASLVDDDATLDGRNAGDIIFGDHGKVYPNPALEFLDAMGELVTTVPPLNNNFFSISTLKDDDGGDDIIFGGDEGPGLSIGDVYDGDIAIGGQGDDVIFGEKGDDDIIGGHNVENGDDEIEVLDGASAAGLDPQVLSDLNPAINKEFNDVLDGGEDDDVIAGDNAVIIRQADDNLTSDRFQLTNLVDDGFGNLVPGPLYTLTSEVLGDGGIGIASVDTGFLANVQGVAQGHLDMADTVRTVYLLNHNEASQDDALNIMTERRWFGNDIIVGGLNDDELFGQLGDDIIQGDGILSVVPGAGALTPYNPAQNADPSFGVLDEFLIDTTTVDITFSVFEALADGNDYIEGNGGSDRIYGGLGQDDIVGGTSSLFLFADDVDQLASDRPDGADLIYGGAGNFNLLQRNAIVGDDTGIQGVVNVDGDTLVNENNRHGRDADTILGDNGNIYQIVEANGDAASHQYDDAYTPLLTGDVADSGYDEQLRVRAVEFRDYGYEFENANTDGSFVLTFTDQGRGAGDLIYGETGDDIIHGMIGNDAIFGNGGDDDLYGEIGSDFLLGGTGRDGILGDDGLIQTSRNNTLAESYNGVAALNDVQVKAKKNDPTDPFALNAVITTPGNIQIAIINKSDQLTKSVELFAFRTDDVEGQFDDSSPETDILRFNDIIFGGLGTDFLHGGDGDDAISGAEALPAYYSGDFDDQNGNSGFEAVNNFLEYQQDEINTENSADDELSDTNPNPFWFSFAPSNPGDILRFGDRDPNEFALYDEFSPRRKIILDTDETAGPDGDVITTDADAQSATAIDFLLNFNEEEGQIDVIEQQSDDVTGDLYNDGDDIIFGDLGNDWIVGGTGRDHMYGGRGSDLLNLDDDHDSGAGTPNNPKKGVNDPIENTQSDEAQAYADIAYGGAGRDVLILNTGADRSIDWVGEFNSYIVPFSPFGAFHISRNLQPQLPDYLEALSDSDGADVSATPSGVPNVLPSVVDGQLYVQQKLADVRTDDPDPDRNYEPFGELGMVRQPDRDWNDQTGAPDDPQPGNFQGKREIMRRELFQDENNVLFADLTGNFEVKNGKFEATPDFVGDQAKSVFYLDATIGNYVEILVDATLAKDKQGYKSNGYIIFDYVSEDDFKFAGINAATDKIEIGHYNSVDGWVVDEQSNKQLRSGVNYELTVALHGTVATIIVDGGNATSFIFDDALNDGLVGLGTENSKAVFDNYQVQQLPPTVTLTQTDDFTGTPTFAGMSGAWNVAGDNYVGVPTGGQPAISLKSFDVQVFSRIWIETTLNTDGSGGVVFDYSEATGFYKFAALDADTNELVIGHVVDGNVSIDESFDFNVVAGRDYDMKVTLIGGSVSVEIDGVAIGGAIFNSLLNDGSVGAFALSGETSFDEITLKTDDPQYAEAEALTAAGSVERAVGIDEVLSRDVLNDAIVEAKAQWLLTGLVTHEQLRAIDTFIIADLPGDLLGLYQANGSILIDGTAAGHGWTEGGMGLVSTIAHEIGHALGFDHGDVEFGALGSPFLGINQNPIAAGHTHGETGDYVHLGEIGDAVYHNTGNVDLGGAVFNGPDEVTSLGQDGISSVDPAIFSEAHRQVTERFSTLLLDNGSGELRELRSERKVLEERWNRSAFIDLLSENFDDEPEPLDPAFIDGRLANGPRSEILDDVLAALKAPLGS